MANLGNDEDWDKLMVRVYAEHPDVLRVYTAGDLAHKQGQDVAAAMKTEYDALWAERGLGPDDKKPPLFEWTREKGNENA